MKEKETEKRLSILEYRQKENQKIIEKIEQTLEQIKEELTKFTNNIQKILAQNQINIMQERLSMKEDILKDTENKYIKKEEFAIIKNGFYGFITLLLGGIIAAILKLILK